MKKRKTLSITKRKRLLGASKVINSIRTISYKGNNIALNEIYLINSNSEERICYSLVFYNDNVIASTDSYYDELGSDVDTEIEMGIRGSIEKYPLLSNNQIAGKSLKLFSSITTTSETDVPAFFKTVLIIEGGLTTVHYPIDNLVELTESGQTVQLNITIFFC